MIELRHVSFTYPDAPRPTFADVDFVVPEGELCLVIGETGSGKSTLLRTINGLVPRFSGGLLTGEVLVAGRRTQDHAPRELADIVGMVGQDPAAGFVTDTVEDELAYVMENLGIAPDAMRRRVEDILDLLGLHELRRRPLSTLSGGQQQRVAIGSVLTASPRILVLDEPTSALDPAAAEEVLAALTRLVHDLGITVLIAEHRLERVLQYADRVISLGAPVAGPSDGSGAGPVDPASRSVIHIGLPPEVMASAAVVPPVVALGRVAGWSPLPLSVRDARRLAPALRTQLASLEPAPASSRVPGSVIASMDKLTATYGPISALRAVTASFARGEIVALMGRNGAGKSTLLSHLVGLRTPKAGRVLVDGKEPHRLSARDGIRTVGLVPQDASLLLYHDRVDEECDAADRDAGLAAGTTRAMLERIVPDVPDDVHPSDLSEGQRLGLVLAIVLAPAPPMLLLDEPTRGLDYAAKQRLVEILIELARDGHGVALATHDVEVVAQLADRVIVLADGEVVADGPARDVVSHSPVFAPQVAKILAPDAWLTVGEVERALAAVGGRDA